MVQVGGEPSRQGVNTTHRRLGSSLGALTLQGKSPGGVGQPSQGPVQAARETRSRLTLALQPVTAQQQVDVCFSLSLPSYPGSRCPPHAWPSVVSLTPQALLHGGGGLPNPFQMGNPSSRLLILTGHTLRGRAGGPGFLSPIYLTFPQCTSAAEFVGLGYSQVDAGHRVSPSLLCVR